MGLTASAAAGRSCSSCSSWIVVLTVIVAAEKLAPPNALVSRLLGGSLVLLSLASLVMIPGND
jgi:predicted metal-binding membrane protein